MKSSTYRQQVTKQTYHLIASWLVQPRLEQASVVLVNELLIPSALSILEVEVMRVVLASYSWDPEVLCVDPVNPFAWINAGDASWLGVCLVPSEVVVLTGRQLAFGPVLEPSTYRQACAPCWDVWNKNNNEFLETKMWRRSEMYFDTLFMRLLDLVGMCLVMIVINRYK